MRYHYREIDEEKQRICKHESPIWNDGELICDDCLATLEPTLERLFYLISHLNWELERIKGKFKSI